MKCTAAIAALMLTMGRYAVDDSAPSQGLVFIDGSTRGIREPFNG